MKNCPRCQDDLQAKLTEQSVIVDVCRKCQGVWLDQGELNFFLRSPQQLRAYREQGLLDKKPCLEHCPKCAGKLASGLIPGFRYQVEECADCLGLFFDAHEFAKLGKIVDLPSARRDHKSEAKNARKPFQIPSLGFTSLAVLASLYAILFGIVVFIVEAGYLPEQMGIPVLLGFVAFQFLVGPWILDFSLQFFGSLSWYQTADLPKNLRESLLRLCQAQRLPIPKVGIINDLSPQAYTYGRTPWSARVVLSQGILELLNEDEQEAVLAHELAHIKNWDFVVMTIAQIVPILLYQIYKMCRRVSRTKSRGRNDGKGKAIFAMAALVAYVAYLLSDYLVKFISRVREYHADRFSCHATGKPNALMSALAKIGYGILSHAPATQENLQAVQSMSIMNVGSGKEFALANHSPEINPAVLQASMQWDLWNPWSAYYELHSTHPLIAKRIRAIADHAHALNIEPTVDFSQQKPESYWDDFARDLFVLVLPIILAIVGFYVASVLNKAELLQLDRQFTTIFATIIGFSLGGIISTLCSYPRGGFVPTTITSLLKLIKISPVRSFPVKLRGKIIGRGDSGNIFSEDMVLQDKTGIVLLNHEPLGFNIFFALFRYQQFIGEDVVVDGWYRRAPIPFVEVSRISTATISSRSYAFTWKLLCWLALPLVYYLFSGELAFTALSSE